MQSAAQVWNRKSLASFLKLISPVYLFYLCVCPVGWPQLHSCCQYQCPVYRYSEKMSFHGAHSTASQFQLDADGWWSFTRLQHGVQLCLAAALVSFPVTNNVSAACLCPQIYNLFDSLFACCIKAESHSHILGPFKKCGKWFCFCG